MDEAAVAASNIPLIEHNASSQSPELVSVAIGEVRYLYLRKCFYDIFK